MPKANTPLIERRSIDFIPETERHGRLYSQFTLWLGANLQITAIVTGALAVVLGGDVFWSLIGLFIGQLLGGGVMALHAVQGPRLGLPQMISSRVQFGVYGAAIPIVLVCLMYLGFTATGTVLSARRSPSWPASATVPAILVFATCIVVATVLGYRVIHWVGRLASVLGILAFCYLFARLISLGDLGDLGACCRSATSAGRPFYWPCPWPLPGRSPMAPMWRTIPVICRALLRAGKPLPPWGPVRYSAPRRP